MTARGIRERKMGRRKRVVPVDQALARTCIGKRQYATRQQATLAARSFPDGDRMGVYRCDACGEFHVGHSRPP